MGLIKDVSIEKLNQDTVTTKELFSAIELLKTPETGFEKFHINDFEGLDIPLDQIVIERVIEKLTHV